MKDCMIKIDNMIAPLRCVAHHYASPLLDLAIRLYMAQIFFQSGWGKFKNFLNDDWGTTVFLFQEAHPLPFLPANVAAVLGTGAELILPVLLAIGLFTRLGAAGLLAMTMAIQFLVPADYGVANPIHYMWMLLLAVPLVKGPGPLSLDYFIIKKLRNKISTAQ
ncbi:MAG TPA: DoxX family protein [Alphaproteobacteria bacterium]|jgi:putative oxidoreductase